jgi:hypothetical protein
MGKREPTYRLAAYGACALLAVLFAWLQGQDLGFDTRHYHLYAGFSALHDRSSLDYFAAGPGAYFNPYAYAPFYSLVSAGLSPLSISCLLALAQSAILCFTYELGVCACPSREQRVRLACGAGAAALALLNPVLIHQLGSSYADITTAALVVWGWLLLARAVRDPRPALVVCAGLLLGAAAALKLTNAVHAVAAATLLIMLQRPWSGRLRYALGYAASLTAGLALVAGPWAYRMTRQFGNPFFPVLNNVFRSPEFTTEPLRNFRFVPDSLAEALWRPFAIAQPDSMVQVEQIAPDIRYAALLVMLGAIAARWLWRRRSRHAGSTASVTAAGDSRVLVALGCGLLTDWVLWLYASGNGRYFLPMASVAAVLLVALPLWQLALRPAITVLAVIIGVQAVQLLMAADFRDGTLARDHRWVEVDVPGKLATEPNLFLSIGVQSDSFIVPYLAPGSGFINFDGSYSLGLLGANGARIAGLMRRFEGHVRVIIEGSRLQPDTAKTGPHRSQVDGALERLGLRVDPDDCETIAALPYAPLLTCAAIPADPAVLQADALRQRAVDLELDRVEDACPQLFQPRRMQTQHVGKVWMRYYAGTDTIAFTNRGEVKFLGLFRGAEVRVIGSESDWAQAPLKLVCGRRNDLYFASVVRNGPG